MTWQNYKYYNTQRKLLMMKLLAGPTNQENRYDEIR